MKAVIAILLLALCSVAFAEEKAKKEEEKPRETRDVRDVLVSPFTNAAYHPFAYRHPTVYKTPTFDYHHPSARYTYKSAEAAAPILKMNTDSHPDGSYNYEYETGNGIRAVENSQQLGFDHVVRGSYSFVAPDGKTYTTHYIADRNGYRAYGDHLPQQPDEVAPLAASRHLTPSASVVVPVQSSTVHPVVTPKSVVVPPKTAYYTQPRYYNPYNAYHPYIAPSYQHYVNPHQPFFVSTVAPPFLVNKK